MERNSAQWNKPVIPRHQGNTTPQISQKKSRFQSFIFSPFSQANLKFQFNKQLQLYSISISSGQEFRLRNNSKHAKSNLLNMSMKDILVLNRETSVCKWLDAKFDQACTSHLCICKIYIFYPYDT